MHREQPFWIQHDKADFLEWITTVGSGIKAIKGTNRIQAADYIPEAIWHTHGSISVHEDRKFTHFSDSRSVAKTK